MLNVMERRTSIDLDSESDLDLDLNSSDDDDGVEAQGDAGFAWSEQLHNVQIDLFTAHKGPKLEDLDINYTSDPYDFLSFSLKTMITIKEQTNCVLNRKEQLDLDQ